MVNMKGGNRDMHKCDLNIFILGRDLHKNEVSFIFENFILNPTLNPTSSIERTQKIISFAFFGGNIGEFEIGGSLEGLVCTN
jgi:hypothetical protein